MNWRTILALRLAMLTVCGWAAAPDIESISPLALRPGVPTEITLSGSGLADAKQLWTSFPARVEWLGEARFRVTAEGPIHPSLALWRPGTQDVDAASAGVRRLAIRPQGGLLAYRVKATGWYVVHVTLTRPGSGSYRLDVSRAS